LSYLEKVKAEIDQALENALLEQPTLKSAPLTQFSSALRYSLFPGGKRLRPALTVAASEAVNGDRPTALTIGAAIEMIHTYSLIHDDLPCMDDSETRRGKLSIHREYDEGTAVLTGDALLADAFALLAELPARHNVAPEVAIEIIRLIARSSGSAGMVGGQMLDLKSTPSLSFPELEWLAIHKTGKLIHASVLSGSLSSKPTEEQKNSLSKYGEYLGLAFQIIDDLEDANEALDIQRPEEPRASFVQILGIDESRERATELINKCIEVLTPLNNAADPLRDIAKTMLDRLPPPAGTGKG